MATALTSQIKLIVDLIRTYDERIELLFDTLPDAELSKSLPGTRSERRARGGYRKPHLFDVKTGITNQIEVSTEQAQLLLHPHLSQFYNTGK